MLDDKFPRLEVGESTIKMSNDLVTLFLDTQRGLLMMTKEQERIMCFSGAFMRVNTDGMSFESRYMTYRGFSSVDFEDERGRGKALVVRMVSPDGRAEMHLRLSMLNNLPGYYCVVQLKNTSGQDIRVASMDTFVMSVDDDTSIYTGRNGEQLRFFRNGFHSWELSQASEIVTGENVSHWFTVLNNHSTDRGVVIGFVTARDMFSQIILRGQDEMGPRLSRIVARCLADDVPLANG
ncbi:MAG: hypothetical protein QXS20_04260, partial [Candidatus Thorarchaeota archaeon]